MQRSNLVRLTALCFAVTAGLASAQYLETTLQLSYGLSDMLWNPSNDHVYVSNWDKGTVTVIDGATNQITAVIDVASDAGFLCLNPTAGRIYCTSSESDTLNVIDALGDTLISSKRVRGYPCMMACSPLVNKLYVGCPDDFMVRVYDGTGTTLVAEITCGEWNMPRLLLWHPVSNRVFCVTGCDAQVDTVLVIDCSTDSVTARIPVGSMPSSICENPVNDLVYVCSRYHLHVLSPSGDSVLAVIPQPYDNSTHICAVPFANKMYVTRGDWVHVIDCDDHVVSESIPAHSGTILCDTDKGKVYGASEPLPVFDARTDTLLMTIPTTGDEWGFVTWNRTDSRVYISSTSNDKVLVVRDTTTAVAEPDAGLCLRDRLDATVCRGRLLLHADAPASLLDLTGRRAAILEPGNNDVRALKSGVYFVQPGNSAPTLKVIIQN